MRCIVFRTINYVFIPNSIFTNDSLSSSTVIIFLTVDRIFDTLFMLDLVFYATENIF